MNTEIRRGEEAKRMLAEPMLGEAFTNVEAGLIGAMKIAALGDQATHHELVLCLQLLGRVKRHFEEAIETGRMAQIQEAWKAKQAR